MASARRCSIERPHRDVSGTLWQGQAAALQRSAPESHCPHPRVCLAQRAAEPARRSSRQLRQALRPERAAQASRTPGVLEPAAARAGRQRARAAGHILQYNNSRGWLAGLTAALTALGVHRRLSRLSMQAQPLLIGISLALQALLQQICKYLDRRPDGARGSLGPGSSRLSWLFCSAVCLLGGSCLRTGCNRSHEVKQFADGALNLQEVRGNKRVLRMLSLMRAG